MQSTLKLPGQTLIAEIAKAILRNRHPLNAGPDRFTYLNKRPNLPLEQITIFSAITIKKLVMSK